MAGSWNHMVVTQPEDLAEEGSRGWTEADIGKPYRDREAESFPLVENMGDAIEAMEECYGMVWWLAQAIAASHGDGLDRQAILDIIENARENYQIGYEFGAGTRPRWWGPRR